MDKIPNGEIFADLQVTLTEIELVKMFKEPALVDRYKARLEGNEEILKSILKIMKDRFSEKDIIQFLEKGFPRKVILNRERW